MTSSADLTILVWNVSHAPPEFPPHQDEVKAVAVSPSCGNPNSTSVATATAAGRAVKIWDLHDSLQATITHTEPVQVILFSSNGENLIVAGDIPALHIHASSTGALLTRLAHWRPSQDSSALFTTLAISEGDEYLAGTSTGSIVIWTNAIPPVQERNLQRAPHPLDKQTSHPTINHINGHLKPIRRLEFTDENTLLSRSTDNALRAWNTKTALITQLDQHPLTLTEFSQEGQRKGILDIRYRGNRLIIAMPTHPIAFLQAPSTITTVTCLGTES